MTARRRRAVVLVAAALAWLAATVATAPAAVAQQPGPPQPTEPVFPPPPAPPEPTAAPTDPGDDPPDDDEDDEDEDGGGIFGGLSDPLWWLPAAPDFPFAYDQRNYDLWNEQCRSDGGSEPDDDAGGGADQDPQLPRALRDMYGPAELACGDEARSDGSLLDEVTGSGRVGRSGIPTSAYDIGYDAGAWNHMSRSAWGLATDTAFSIAKWTTAATVSVLEWAFAFDLSTDLTAPADRLAAGYYVGLAGTQVNVYDLALFAALVWFAVALLRGQVVAAVTELALTWLVFVVFLVSVVTVPGGFGALVSSVTDVAAGLAGGIAEVTLDDADTSRCTPGGAAGDVDASEVAAVGGARGAAVVCAFGGSLHTAMVEQPYDLLNWGRDLDVGEAGGACATARDRILEAGPHGADDWPRFEMGIAGCETEADFNHDPTPERAGYGAMVALTAVIVLGLVMLCALTLVVAQLLLIGLVVVLPFAVAAGLVPGGGRMLLWRWVGAVARTIFVVAAVALFLSLYLATVGVVVEVTADDHWLVQGGTLVAITVAMFVVRSRLVKGGKAAGTAVGDRLNAAQIGGARPGLVAAAATASQGRGSGRYGVPYEYRMAARDARSVTTNTAEWAHNTRTRRAIRTGRVEGVAQPPRGFTASRRARSAARHRRAASRRAVRSGAGR